jgi:hypothetical protein
MKKIVFMVICLLLTACSCNKSSIEGTNSSITTTAGISVDKPSLGWLYNQGTYTYTQKVKVSCSTHHWHLNQIIGEFGVKDEGGAIITPESGQFGSDVFINIYALDMNMTNTAKLGKIILHDLNHVSYEIEVIQTAKPKI